MNLTASSDVTFAMGRTSIHLVNLSTARPYSIEAPHSEGPRRRDGAQDLSWQVLLFGKELTSFASLHEVFSVSYGRGLVESRSIRFTDQIGGCRVTATFVVVDLS
jgi:hypothetical protein